MLIFDPQPWMARASCRGMTGDLFFPARGEDLEPARAVCRACPAREDCLGYALDAGIKEGIWGGLSERQRRGMRRSRDVVAPVRPAPAHGTLAGYRAELAAGIPTCPECRRVNNLRSGSVTGYRHGSAVSRTASGHDPARKSA